MMNCFTAIPCLSGFTLVAFDVDSLSGHYPLLDALKAVEGTGQTASELSRQSLYVKFDPLVDT